jgi:hypothetical protein
MLALVNVLEKRSVKRKTLIISKGDAATEMYFVVRGEASVLDEPEDAKEKAVATISPSNKKESPWCAPPLSLSLPRAPSYLCCCAMAKLVRGGRCADWVEAQRLCPRGENDAAVCAAAF